MRKLDKKINIEKVNLLNEQIYSEQKKGLLEGIDEDWKTNVAAGLATLGGVSAANAQSVDNPKSDNITKNIQQQVQSKNYDNVANPYNDKSDVMGNTKEIVKIQTGVQDGKTGNPSVYVYSKDPTDPTFNVETDRETVFTKNLENLTRTTQYQDYLKRMHAKKQEKAKQQLTVNESNKKIMLDNFNLILNKIK